MPLKVLKPPYKYTKTTISLVAQKKKKKKKKTANAIAINMEKKHILWYCRWVV